MVGRSLKSQGHIIYISNDVIISTFQVKGWSAYYSDHKPLFLYFGQSRFSENWFEKFKNCFAITMELSVS